MSENDQQKKSGLQKIKHLVHQFELSAVITVIGVILLFLAAIISILWAPRHVDTTWITPTSPYQVQMYDVEDPNIYISSQSSMGRDLQYVHHLKQDFTLLAFKESENTRIIASSDLEKYVTHYSDTKLKLTSRLLLLRHPEGEAKERADKLRQELQQEWEKAHPNWEQAGLTKIDFLILELYDTQLPEAFSIDLTGDILQNWIDEDFVILDDFPKQLYHQDYGVVYVLNPIEYRISPVRFGDIQRWHYDSEGRQVKDLTELLSPELGFHSRKELIQNGEQIYAIEGCWYCHTDQTRTLIQDTILNGAAEFPAPPSSANEYIYQKITFPGTRRIGPDLSRVGVKRPSRDWHKSHFWSPKTASVGSIMPAFQHFFDEDPRGKDRGTIGIPNYQFESIYQYLMTKGTRITAPTEAWWLGKDPVKTKEIIEGRKRGMNHE